MVMRFFAGYQPNEGCPQMVKKAANPGTMPGPVMMRIPVAWQR